VSGLGGAGIPDDHPLAAWVLRRLTPHPLSTCQSPLTLRFPLGNDLPRTYVHCASPSYETLGRYASGSGRSPAGTGKNWRADTTR
jgi:hypothetical protein